MQLVILHQIITIVNLQLIVHDWSIKPEVQTSNFNRIKKRKSKREDEVPTSVGVVFVASNHTVRIFLNFYLLRDVLEENMKMFLNNSSFVKAIY